MKAIVAMAAVAAAMTLNAAQAQDKTQDKAPDLAAGERSFVKCKICHRIGEGAKSLVGPELNGLDGRKAGSVPDFSYSEANKNSGIVWSEATFKEYIKDPRAKLPKTKMVFPGIKDEKEQNDLWAYLKQFGPDGKKK